MERQLAQARESRSRAEAALAGVKADGTLSTYDEWCLRSSAASGARREAHLLEVDERCLREQLERALFLAQHDKAVGRQRCRACQGTGEGPAIPGGISIDHPPCDSCAGIGVVRVESVVQGTAPDGQQTPGLGPIGMT
jgi:hypothetical protein